jgi:hypothetical protein
MIFLEKIRNETFSILQTERRTYLQSHEESASSSAEAATQGRQKIFSQNLTELLSSSRKGKERYWNLNNCRILLCSMSISVFVTELILYQFVSI